MSTTNELFKVLVLPNSAADTSGHISALANGHWGVFSVADDTAVELDSGSGADAANVPAEFYIAYRGNGTLGVAGKLYMSAGQKIQLKNLRSYSVSAPASATAQTVIITPNYSVVEQGYDYGVKLDFRGNTEVYQRYGANQAVKTFIGSTHCALPAEDAAYANTVIADLFMGIVNDADQFMDAAIAYTDDGNKTITYTHGSNGSIGGTGTLAALKALDSTAAATLTITINAISEMYSWANINPKYFKLRGIKAIPSLAGADCVWAAFTGVAMVYGTNYGYDVKELEFEAGGWDGKPGPYRQSGLHGLPFTGFEYLTPSDTAQYTINCLQYDNEYTAGWMNHKAHMATYLVSVGATGTSSIANVLLNIATAGALTP